jgi:TolB-like protein/Tfp pilus assembly protein PilF
VSLIHELKRRNVIRMAGLYLVGAWLIVQVAGTLLPMFGAPDWVPKTVVILLAIGFLPALAFAWAFELTPDGIKRDAEVAPEASIAPQTARRMDRLIIAVLVLALGVFAVERFMLVPRSNAHAEVARLARTQVAAEAAPAAAGPALGKQSIAVLPFADLSPGKDQEYFSDGMAEEILNALAQVKGLKVAGRTSSFQYKGRNEDLRGIGKALGVAHILEGSVRKQGERVRITAQLIQASDGSHLWSETYDGDLRDVFQLQENIARAITDKLQIVLKEGQQLVPVATTNTDAYGLFLQATQIFDKRIPDRMVEAARMLEQAVELDPSYARAWSRLAAVYAILPTYAGTEGDRMMPQLQAAARRAIALDPTLAEPWAVLGLTSSQGVKDQLASRVAFEKALALEPDDVTANFWYGLTLLRSGYRRAGVERIEHALSVDPMRPNVVRWRGVVALREGDLVTAQRYLERAQAAGLSNSGRELGELAGRRGRVTEAAALWRSAAMPLMREMPEGPEIFMAGLFGDAAARTRAIAMLEQYVADDDDAISGLVPLMFAQLGEGARALELASTKVHGDDSDFMHYVFSPEGAALRALPWFPAFVEGEGLTVLWAKYGPPDYQKP